MTVLNHRFWAKVAKTESCWNWTGALQSQGYGCWSVDGKRVLTHRVAYTELVGPIPDGLQIDHLCRNRACCNPAHLEPVTAGENVRRTPEATKTHCKWGHPLSGANLGFTGTGTRKCRECNRRHSRERKERLRIAAALGEPVGPPPGRRRPAA